MEKEVRLISILDLARTARREERLADERFNGREGGELL